MKPVRVDHPSYENLSLYIVGSGAVPASLGLDAALNPYVVWANRDQVADDPKAFENYTVLYFYKLGG